jgi:PucR family transcriptional regulator, purine catabolism regulatory protein
VPEREYLSVRELVTDAGFDLRLLTGDIGLDQPIRGIHLSDYEDPTPWMAVGSLLITTGASFFDSPEAAVQFLERIIEKDTVALGVGVGQHGHLTHVCPEMVARARELRIPVFEIPETVPFRTMFAYVYDALASTDMHRLRRALSFQAQLLDLLLDEKGIAEVLARLAGILRMTVLLFDAYGHLVAQADAGEFGPSEAERVWKTYEAIAEHGPPSVLEADRGRLHFREIIVHGTVERVLAAVVHQPPASNLAEIALSFAQRLINLDLLRESEQVALRRRMRALLLDDLLSRSDVDSDIAQRLLDQGIDLRRQWRVIICRWVDPPSTDGSKPDEKASYEFRARLCNVAETFLGKHRLQIISMVKSDQIVLLLVVEALEGEATQALLVNLRKRLGREIGSTDVAIGASEPSGGSLTPSTALRQAGEAAQAAAEGAGLVEGVVRFEEVWSRFRLLTGQSDEELTALVEKFIEPLVAHDKAHHTSLLPTLRAYFENRLNAHDTARALYIHRNTLPKRLHRIEELLQINLAGMDEVLELYVGLRAADLLAWGEPR